MIFVNQLIIYAILLIFWSYALDTIIFNLQMLRHLTHFSKSLFSKRIIYQDECNKIIADTAQEIAKIAAITLGPMGRNVVIEDDKNLPRITKDGVTVVKHIEYVVDNTRRKTDLRTQSAL